MFWSDLNQGPVFFTRLDPDLVFKIWSDPDPFFKIWSNLDPVFIGRIRSGFSSRRSDAYPVFSRRTDSNPGKVNHSDSQPWSYSKPLVKTIIFAGFLLVTLAIKTKNIVYLPTSLGFLKPD